MMFEILYILTALAGTFGIALWDLKTSDVSDKACYFMIGLGISLHLIETYYIGDVSILYSMLMSVGAFLLIGSLMYYTGQWGDGDAAVLVAIGALLPTIPSPLMPFALSYFINLSVIGAIYSIIYALIIAQRNGAYRLFRKSLYLNRGTLFWLTGLIAMTAVTMIIFFPSLIMLLALPPFFVVTALLYFFIKAIDSSFRRKMLASKLKEGDVIADSIPQLGIVGKRITGLTMAQVSKIKRMRRYVTVIDGIRYTPAFFISLLYTLLFGSVLTLLFL
jgi:hypothetical protein